jgi:dihydroxyacetone kinase DhaKLM complex PTS-EIIA-like component DhaM
MFYALAKVKNEEGFMSTIVFGDVGSTRLEAELNAEMLAKEKGAILEGIYKYNNYMNTKQMLCKEDQKRLKKMRANQ